MEGEGEYEGFKSEGGMRKSEARGKSSRKEKLGLAKVLLGSQMDEDKVVARIIEKIQDKKIPNMVYPYTYDKIRYIIDNIKTQISRIPHQSLLWTSFDTQEGEMKQMQR